MRLVSECAGIREHLVLCYGKAHMTPCLTLYTCVNRAYEDFVPLFSHSALYHCPEVAVEVGIQDYGFSFEYLEAVRLIQDAFPDRFKLSQVDFGPYQGFGRCPNVVRFMGTPQTRNPYIYISDADIITLAPVLEPMRAALSKSGLSYVNLVRPEIPGQPRRLTGTHFSYWDAYYPLPDFSDLLPRGFLSWDECFLYEIVSRKTRIDPAETFCPTFGIHASPNQPLGGGPLFWSREWRAYRASLGFLELETLFSARIRDLVGKIDRESNI